MKQFNSFLLLVQITLVHFSEGKLPASVDWRQYAGSKGIKAGVYVNPVQDEGSSCNASYAFAAMASLESRQAITYQTSLTKLSEQNIIDCTSCSRPLPACKGCVSGTPESAWAYAATVNCGSIDRVQPNGEKPWRGVNYQSVYPYTGEKQTCAFKTGSADIGAIPKLRIWNGNKRAFFNVAKMRSPLEMRKAVAQGPVVIQVPEEALNHYKGGVLMAKDCKETYPKRYVVIVGYGKSGKVGYWLVRNSKGTSWGEAGYAKLQRSTKKNNSWDGTCGILKYGRYATPTCQHWSDCYLP